MMEAPVPLNIHETDIVCGCHNISEEWKPEFPQPGGCGWIFFPPPAPMPGIKVTRLHSSARKPGPRQVPWAPVLFYCPEREFHHTGYNSECMGISYLNEPTVCLKKKKKGQKWINKMPHKWDRFISLLLPPSLSLSKINFRTQGGCI